MMIPSIWKVVNPTKAVIYARYSSDNQREESIEGQIRECTEYAVRNDMTILTSYIDRALSARTADRPEFQRMIHDSEKGLFDVVLVWKLDRFSRDRYDSAHYKRILKKNGVRVISARENISEGPEGIILESMLEGYAEYYSAELSEKIQRGQKENALKCRSNGGNIPLGYVVGSEGVLETDSATAPLVREIFTRYENGETLKAIADSLNKRGLRTRKGSAFRVATLSVILKNRKYIGEYKYADTVIPNGIPAIIEPDLFVRVQQRMEGNKKAPSRTKADEEYLLTTKLFCGDCGRLMVGESGTSGTNGAKYYYYKCGGAKRRLGCKRKPLKKHWIERVAVVTTVQRVLRDKEINRIADAIIDLQNQEDTSIPAMRQQLKACEKAIENMLNAIQMGILTPSTKTRLEELEAQRENLKVSILQAELEKPKYTKEQIVSWINRFKYGNVDDIEYQRQIIDTFINAIYVYDDKLAFTYNYKDGSATITPKEIEEAFGSDLTQVAPPFQTGLPKMAIPFLVYTRLILWRIPLIGGFVTRYPLFCRNRYSIIRHNQTYEQLMESKGPRSCPEKTQMKNKNLNGTGLIKDRADPLTSVQQNDPYFSMKSCFPDSVIWNHEWQSAKYKGRTF